MTLLRCQPTIRFFLCLDHLDRANGNVVELTAGTSSSPASSHGQETPPWKWS